MLHIFNSMTRTKELFKPIEAGKVSIYVCGITVYDYCHIGHGRMFVVFDAVVRYLRHLGYSVNYVRNITDIDDKIIHRSAQNQEPFQELTQRFIQAMHKDCQALNIQAPSLEPRATEFIDNILLMIQQLIGKGLAYQAENGDVYYDISQFPNYGKLAGKKLDELQAGSRVEVQDSKQNPLDFVLWKKAKPGEPSWESPWGLGRPGWHIECSAMSTTALGDHFDIHGGGMDLMFPHHENEIAQSEGATGHPFVNYWMHNGFVQVDAEKMSKSLNNFFTIHEVLDRFSGEELRYFFLASHYRSPVSYSMANLEKAHGSLMSLYTALRGIQINPEHEIVDPHHQAQFNNAMDDDFNTPEAISVLFDLAHQINRCRNEEPEKAARLAYSLKFLGGVLGLLETDPENFLQAARSGSKQVLKNEEIEELVASRNQARTDRNWAEADRIRGLLESEGILLEDSAQGTKWRRK